MFNKLKEYFFSNKSRADLTNSTIALTGGTLFENVFRFARNMILTRIIAPEYFGLMATIIAVITIFEAISEVGVRQAIIQNKRGATSEFLNVAWWFSFVWGLFLFLIGQISTPFICDFYQSSELLKPLRLTYFVLLFNSIVSPRIHVLEKEFKFFKWVILKKGSALLNVAVSLVTCIYFKDVWPLVFGVISEYVSIFLFSYIYFPFKPSLHIDKPSFHELLKFAKGMFGLPLLTAIFLQIDIFTIGKVLTMVELGFYSIAQRLAFLPHTALTKIVPPLLLPTFSKLQDDRNAMQLSILKAAKIIAIIILPLFAYFIVFARPLLSVVFGSQYGGVAIPFSILVIYTAIRIYSNMMMQIFLALGKPNLHRNIAMIRVLVVGTLIYPAIIYFKLAGAAFVVMLGMSIVLTLQIKWSKKLIGMKFISFFRALLPGFYLALAVIVLNTLFQYFFRGNDITAIMCGLFICLTAWAGVVISFLKNELNVNLLSLKMFKFIKIDQ